MSNINPQANRDTLNNTLGTKTVSELEALFKENGAGLTESQLAQTRAPLSSLHIAPLVFQPRNMKEKPWEKERHIGNLAKVARQPKGMLDPILVFPIAGFRIVVDGHCRREALFRAKWQPSKQVAVKHLRCSFAEALAYSASNNAKDKLALSYFEKSEKAWQLVRFNEGKNCYTCRSISRATGVGKSTVSNMQRRLIAEDGSEIASMSWADVLRKDRGDEDNKYDDTWEEQTAQDWAVRLRKTFGEKPNAQPRVFQKALEIAYSWDVSRGNDWDLDEDGDDPDEPSDF